MLMKNILSVLMIVLLMTSCTSPQQHQESEIDSVDYHAKGDTPIVVLPLDSSTYANEKQTLEGEIHQFLDSINTLISYTQGLRGPKNREVLDESISKLTTIKDVVERHLEEVNTTSQKSWDSTMVKRIRMHMKKTKKEVEDVKNEVDKNYKSVK